MSRLYDARFEIVTDNPEPIRQALNASDWMDNNMEYCDYEESCKMMTFFGEIVLSGGMSEEEAHDEIAKIVHSIDPKAELTTKWHDKENWDWDAVISKNEDGETTAETPMSSLL